MKRIRISTTTRVKIFTKDDGICHLCNMKVLPGQEWDVSHEVPLEAGGADDMTNWRVAHRKCHRKHTAEVDIPVIAKLKRVSARHIGAKVSKNPIPGSKNSPWKRKMDGTVVRRDKV